MRISDWSSDVCSSDLGEVVAPEEIDVTPEYRRESSDIGGQRWRPGLAELAHGFLHVDSVPVDDGVEGETEDPELLLLARSEEHTSELQSLMRISYAVFCLKKKKNTNQHH